ncbi:dipeptidyl-peptidase-4 [Colwellia chukchiensis]|uniref:Dipeptidyl-peptidase-4 n=1 Tax=Colwellia chukchiensis TaxID=641665 RepID=A0A1H7NA42_9GAMM|nr:S9 family peptidase [Colwellia chukchiensis]SEL19805.1 dipeptidyl-peptidase-4 [Colwellia chukchiensis]
MNNLYRWCTLAALSVTLMACQNTPNDNKHEQQKAMPITLDQIYHQQTFKSQWLGQIRWLADGSGYTAVEKSRPIAAKSDQTHSAEDIVFYHPQTLARTVLIAAEQLIPEGSTEPLAIDNYLWSNDRSQLLIYTNSKKVWRSNSRGDYWLLKLKTRKLTRLGGENVKDSSLMFAKFSPDGNRVAYVFDNNIYVESLSNHSIKQVTSNASEGIINGLFDWVYEEEFSIRDGFRWSPDGNSIAYWQLDTRGSKDFIMINNTDALYPSLTRFPYPKVGEQNALAKIGIVDLATAKTTWAKLPNNSRDMYVPRMNWSGNSSQVLIQHVNRKQDTNHLYLTDIKTGQVSLVLTEQEENFLDFYDDAQWLTNGNHFIWKSERSGWRHIYKVARDGTSMLNLTDGAFDITELTMIDEQQGWLYFIASPDNVAQRYLYRSKLDGSLLNQRVTPAQYMGINQYQMSPDGQWAIHRHSSFDTPTTAQLIKVEGHQQQQQLMTNEELHAQMAKLAKPEHEFFQVTAQDGVVLDGYIMRPANFDATKKYPIIFYVYGEPAGQTAQDKWRGNAYFWDQLLTEQGFIVASIDNRGTPAPKGRAWRKSIYGAVGILASRDQADALKAMAARWSYIDTERVGIWGHSGGGSMTLNMLFRYPELYQVGIALAPVADQRLYDSIYQERYSGLLTDYAESYQQSSPITHAKNLQGKLLLVHGTGDDNVHYQGTERLINELIKHNRQFDFMSYPNRSHSIREGEGTSLHLKTMMTNYFNEHLK